MSMRIDKRLFTYIRYMRLYIVVLGGLSALAACLIVLQAHFITTLINGFFLGRQSSAQILGQGPGQSLRSGQIPFLGQVASPWLLLVVIGVRAGLLWVNEVLAHRMATRAKDVLHKRLFEHLLKLGPSF